jgi:hypothetical protein
VKNEDVLRQMGVSPTVAGKPPRLPGMHRTPSIEDAVVLSGEIDMPLDDSEVKLAVPCPHGMRGAARAAKSRASRGSRPSGDCMW